MADRWRDHLRSAGARLAGDRVADFGDPQGEREAARSGTVLSPLLHFGVLRAEGEDAQTFLHGQLTSDLSHLAPGRSQYSGYCTPKGRLLATLLLWRDAADAVMLMLPRELAEPLRKRLAMFVLRSRVRLADASDACTLLGLAGPSAAGLLEAAGLPAPQEAFAVATAGGAQVIALPGARCLVAIDAEAAPRIWDLLSARARPVGSSCWDWLDIRSGVPTVRAATNEAFVPQMVNLEAIGGVSFRKGCYPGQEIVARTQYLGKLKRRMFLANVSAERAPQPGDELFGTDTGDQATGIVVSAETSPDGGFDLLAVIHVSSVEAGPVRFGAADGPALRFMPLPYAA